MQSGTPTPYLLPSSATRPRRFSRTLSRRLRLRTAPAYFLALTVPFLASWATYHSPGLQTVPWALYFIAAAIIAALDGAGPALLSIVLSILTRNYYFHSGHLLYIDSLEALRAVILLILTTAVAVIGSRERRIATQLEEALELLQDRSNALIESLHGSKCASWILDLDSGRAAHWYEGSFQVFGRPFAELEGMKTLAPLLYEPDQPRLRALLETMRTSHDPVVFEHRVPWPDGDIHWLEMRATRTNGPAPIWRGVTVDITDRKLAETALLRQEKLAAMGRLASTVAHEVNNPLEAVTNLLYLIRSDDTISETSREYLAMAESELARLAEITRLTLGFVRTNANRRTVLIAEAIDTTLAIFRQRFTARGIRIERHYQPGVTIDMAPSELRQVITNLVSNAADAMPPPTPGSDKTPSIHIHIFSEPATAVIHIEDNGSGISPENTARIFEPFFTTKDDVGTGIGLWVTRELIESNGGTISVVSGSLPNNMATRFRIEFPLAASTQALDPPSRERPAYIP